MITQTYNQGKNVIEIETAESIEDAQENGFQEGVYSRFLINGKKVSSYMSFIQEIIKEVKLNKTSLVPDSQKIAANRESMIRKNHSMMIDNLKALRQQYASMNVPENVMTEINDLINKCDPVTGMRVSR